MEAQMNPDPQPNPNSNENNAKRKKTLLILGGIFLLLALIALIYWFFYVFEKESTDDAYVNGNMITLYPRVTGAVNSYYVDDTQIVEEGQKILDLDPLDLEIAFESQKTALALAVRDVAQLQQQVLQTEAEIRAQQARLDKLQIDFNNRMGLINAQAISKEELDHARADLDAAKADLEATEHRLQAQKLRLGPTSLEDNPQVQSAVLQTRNAYINLWRGTIYSPARGFIAQRRVQVGENVKLDRALLSILPLDQIWVDANFKERQLSDIRIGQPARVWADMWGSKVEYRGKVYGIEPGSGSVFSLLPAQNATGNWIKIVQRVPVRIVLDPDQVAKFPLFLGLSMYVTVDTSDTSGHFLHQIPNEKQLAGTTVFEVPEEQLRALVDSIIKENR